MKNERSQRKTMLDVDVDVEVALRPGSSKLGRVFLIKFRLKWEIEYQLQSI